MSFYTATCHKLAAHGYLVIALNHQDESCFFTIDKDGKDIPHVLKDNDLPYRKTQMATRTEEVLSVIETLKTLTPELHFEIFGGFAPNAKIDMSELILAGHSYGSATMIATDSKIAESV